MEDAPRTAVPALDPVPQYKVHGDPMTPNSRTEDMRGQWCALPSNACETTPDLAWRGRREIGPWGTTARVVTGVAAIAVGVAVPHRSPLLDLPGAGSDLVGLLVGLVGVPVSLTLAVWVRGRTAPQLRLGHGAACLVTLLTVGAAQFYPVAVWVGIGAPLLLLAAVGRSGCELLAVPNLVLRRDDYLFCLPFSPLDAWERRRRTSSPTVSSASSESGPLTRRD